MEKDPFKEYIKEAELGKREKGYAWHTAIGLQAVDGLKPSKYLVDTAIRNSEGDISIDEAGELLNSYYKENPSFSIRSADHAPDFSCEKRNEARTPERSEPRFWFVL